MSRDYLSIEPFLGNALECRALQAAFDLGVIDFLEAHQESPISELISGRDCDESGANFLLSLLELAGVVECNGPLVRMTDAFQSVLSFKDLITTKLTFANYLAGDYFDRMPQLLRSTADFMESSRLFELFDYSRCFEINTSNCMHAARWMQLTTMLSRYEGPVLAELRDLRHHRRLLDVGGNSGEFALQLCSRFPELRASILDLPVVSSVGERHIASRGLAERIRFYPGNMLEDPFRPCDLLTWKSVLHDWPDSQVPALLEKSHDALDSGGTLLIFERQRLNQRAANTSFGNLPVILFFRSYRSSEAYSDWLQQAGFVDIESENVELEVPFLLMSARKP